MGQENQIGGGPGMHDGMMNGGINGGMHGGAHMMNGGDIMHNGMMNSGFGSPVGFSGPMGFIGPIVGAIIHIIFFAFALYIIWVLVKLLRTYISTKIPVEGSRSVNTPNRLTDNDINAAISKGQTPLSFLQYRLVNGEISPEEYRAIKLELLDEEDTENNETE